MKETRSVPPVYYFPPFKEAGGTKNKHPLPKEIAARSILVLKLLSQTLPCKSYQWWQTCGTSVNSLKLEKNSRFFRSYYF
jgi:hypothetical protein